MKKKLKFDFLNLPFFMYSKAVGEFSRTYLPSPLNKIVLGAYAAKFGVNIDEVELPLEEYHSLYAFFTRKLKKGIRVFPDEIDVVSSPSDGIIRDFGDVREAQLIQAKKYFYTLSSLIGEEFSPFFHNGFFVTIYLRPGDYHRFHYPVTGTIKKFSYFPGKIFPVNPAADSKIPGLYTMNERVFVLVETASGKVGVVIVGASAVGEIHMTHWPELKTNRFKRRYPERISAEIKAKAGEEMGFFGMGSTIILLLEKGKLSSSVKEGNFVKAGTIIALLS